MNWFEMFGGKDIIVKLVFTNRNHKALELLYSHLLHRLRSS